MRKAIDFVKMHGAGNDFIVIDNRSLRLKRADLLARVVCDRHRGVGADGLLLVERSRKADYRMMYYNADGSYGGMCGNGGRCIAAFAVANRIASRKHRFEALDHVYRAEVASKGIVRLWMKDPKNVAIGHSFAYGDQILSLHTVDTGSPHAVVFVRRGGLKNLDVVGIGRWVRNHEVFKPEGVNVNFVERIGIRSIAMRTYERGVEAETQACGTGSVASSVLGSVLTGLSSPVVVLTSSGDKLRVLFSKSDDGIRDVILEGPVVTSFKGRFHV